MATHLRRMRIGKVSLVDRGANGERIAVLKSASKEDQMGDVVKGRPQFTKSRTERIKALRQELDDLIGEVDQEDAVEKAEEGPMLDIQRLAEELTPLIAPIIAERVDKAVSEAVAKMAPQTESGVTMDTVVEALGLIDGRLSDIEKSRSQRQSAPIAGEVSKAVTSVRATLASSIL